MRIKPKKSVEGTGWSLKAYSISSIRRIRMTARLLAHWRRALLAKVLVVASSGLLVAYLLGILGGAEPTVWKYMVDTACATPGLPSFATLIEEKKNRTVTRVDALNRSNPLDSGDWDPVTSPGCERLSLNAPGSTAHLFALSGVLQSDGHSYQSNQTALTEDEVCRFSSPGLEGQKDARVDAGAQGNQADKVSPSVPNTCPRSQLLLPGPVYVVGGEMAGSPGYLDFSRQGAFISVSVQGTQVARVLSEHTADQTYQMAFWLLVPPKHSLLVQRTTPAPIAVIPTDSGTLFKFSVILLPFPKGGDSGGQFLAGALSFVYEADARASMRDYLVFILAAVFAFALERVVDAMSTRKEAHRE